MATEAKASSASSSCLSFLKDALLLPTRNAKLFVPVFLLVCVSTLLLQITNVFSIQPLAEEILLQNHEIKNMDPTSPDYVKLLEQIMKEGRELVLITISVTIITLVLSFASQIVAFFAASTTRSGDRYTLPELLSKVIVKGHRFKGPLVTAVLVSVLNCACMVLLAVLLHQLMMRHLAVLYVALLLVFPFLVFLYLNVVFMVAMAVSAADTERRGMSALQQAWRLMTRVWRKQGCALVIVLHLVGMVPSPLYAVALSYTKKSMPMGLALLFVYALLSGLVLLFSFAAATEYYYQAMESKETMPHDYVKIPTGEATV